MPVANLGKVAVISILERGGKVKTIVVPNRKKAALQARFAATSKRVRLSAMTPCSLPGDYAHKVVDHAVEYVNGRVHRQRP